MPRLKQSERNDLWRRRHGQARERQARVAAGFSLRDGHKTAEPMPAPASNVPPAPARNLKVATTPAAQKWQSDHTYERGDRILWAGKVLTFDGHKFCE